MPETTPTPEKTIADELREAAARSREHLLPEVVAEVLPHTALVVLCSKVHEESEGTCRDCLMFDVRDVVLARLVATLLNAREPLGAWLEKTAEDFEGSTSEDTPECPNCTAGTYPCGGHGTWLFHEGGCGGVINSGSSEDCACFATPLAVARVINGTTPQEVATHV